MRVSRFLAAFIVLCSAVFHALASESTRPSIGHITSSNGVKTLTINPAPAIDVYNVLSSQSIFGPFTNDPAGTLNGLTFTTTNNGSFRFYTVAAMPMSSNSLLSANLLNRIAFGPSPQDLERLTAIGPAAYIAEQLAPETVPDTFNSTSAVQKTNSVPSSGVAEWRQVTVNGTFSSSNLYVYLITPGRVYLDDIELRPVISQITTNVNGTNITYTTNQVLGANVVRNGDFENVTLTPPWNVTANVAGSSLSTTYARSGARSLQLVSAAAGSTQNNSLWQSLTNLTFGFNANTQRCQFSFWYLESTNSSIVKMRLSGNGVNASGSDAPPEPEWLYATATGRATGTPTIYLYLSGAGECYIDDLKIVPGSVPEVGSNRVRNADFEAPLSNLNWSRTADFANSHQSTAFAHSGLGSLKLIATAAGGGSGDSVFQTNVPGLTNNSTYTVSFWHTRPTSSRTLTVRLSGSALVATAPQGDPGLLQWRLDEIGGQYFEDGAVTAPTVGGARLADLRAWFVMNCVGNERQLLHVLLQFLENHFVTQHSKSVDYFDRFYNDGTIMDIFATDWEYRELVKWRNALLNSNCTFYDLLRISTESPAMIVYLDSVDSRGDARQIANENYAREIMELFCMGVDNGYDQQDITVMSRAWSGWSVDIVDPWNIDNPHAARTERVGFYPGAGSSGTSNRVGVWTFNYKPANHGTNRAPVWSVWNNNPTNPQPIGVKTVPARFGSPWAGQPYALYPANAVPVRTGTAGIQDGYDILTKIADLPFTMEYISVKLCRLFIHDDFEHGIYDYTDPNRSAEAELIRQCMVAWDTPGSDGRKGNIRSILGVILGSELFRGHGGSMQKVKTPLEYAVSSIRALRAGNGRGGQFASTDGYSISGRDRAATSAPLTRMGAMMLFDRDAPDGYPETGAPWISAGTLAERVRFIQTALMAVGASGKSDGISGGNFNNTDPVGLLKSKLPSTQWSDAGAVSDFFLSVLYPAEGKGNLASYRALAVDFLNLSDDATTNSLFSGLVNTSAQYDTRVRAMVAMLMTLPRFQEQ